MYWETAQIATVDDVFKEVEHIEALAFIRLDGASEDSIVSKTLALVKDRLRQRLAAHASDHFRTTGNYATYTAWCAANPTLSPYAILDTLSNPLELKHYVVAHVIEMLLMRGTTTMRNSEETTEALRQKLEYWQEEKGRRWDDALPLLSFDINSNAVQDAQESVTRSYRFNRV